MTEERIVRDVTCRAILCRTFCDFACQAQSRSRISRAVLPASHSGANRPIAITTYTTRMSVLLSLSACFLLYSQDVDPKDRAACDAAYAGLRRGVEDQESPTKQGAKVSSKAPEGNCSSAFTGFYLSFVFLLVQAGFVGFHQFLFSPSDFSPPSFAGLPRMRSTSSWRPPAVRTPPPCYRIQESNIISYIIYYIRLYFKHVDYLLYFIDPPDRPLFRRVSCLPLLPSFIGWSNNHSNSLHSKMSLETNPIITRFK